MGAGARVGFRVGVGLRFRVGCRRDFRIVVLAFGVRRGVGVGFRAGSRNGVVV